MYVRLLIGAHCGEIQDVANDAALAMLADGRAEDPFVVSEVVAEVSNPAKGKGKR